MADRSKMQYNRSTLRQLSGPLLALALIAFLTLLYMLKLHTVGMQSSSMASVGDRPLQCGPFTAAEQAKFFSTRPVTESACTPHVWLKRLQALQPGGKKVFVDIGCNKGYHTVELFDMFVPSLNVNKATLRKAYESIRKRPDQVFCGACDVARSVIGQIVDLPSCTAVHTQSEDVVGSEAVAYCIEPSDVHHANLQNVRNMLLDHPLGTPTLKNNDSSITWHLHNFAVSNYSGTSYFTSSCDTELCHLEQKPRLGQNTYKVKVVTVDEMMEHIIGWGNHVTYMKVDTEGYDALVLKGAEQALKRKVIDLLSFEYHYLGHWSNTQLKDAVHWMEAMGYSCYFEGLEYVFKLSRNCWNSSFEVYDWSNVVCGRAGHWPEQLLDSFSYLARLPLDLSLDPFHQGNHQAGPRSSDYMTSSSVNNWRRRLSGFADVRGQQAMQLAYSIVHSGVVYVVLGLVVLAIGMVWIEAFGRASSLPK